MTIKQQAQARGLHPNTVYNRVARGWTLEDALTKPARRHGVVSRKVLACVRETPGLTAREIADRIGEPHEIVRVALFCYTRDEVLIADTDRQLVRGRSTEVRRYRADDEIPTDWPEAA